MSGPRLSRLLRTCNAILHVASWIVPRSRRSDWLTERKTKVFHWCHFLAESGRLSSATAQEVRGYCWHSCKDALWTRFNRDTVLRLINEVPRTPEFLVSGLFAVLLLLLVGGSFTGLRTRLSTGSSVDSARTLQVSLDRYAVWMEPELLRDEAQQWSSQEPSIERVGVYAVRPSLIHGDRGSEYISAARVTPETFRLLNARPVVGRLFQETDASTCNNCVVLNSAVWQSQFHGDKNVIGRLFELNKTVVRVIGVTAVHFPGQEIGLYTLFGPDQPRLPTFEWPGALIQLSPGTKVSAVQPHLQRIVDHSLKLSAGTRASVMSLRQIRNQAFWIWAGMFGLALAIVCALNWRLIAQVVASGPRRDSRAVLNWYGFLAAKTGLLLLIVLVASFEVVQIFIHRFSTVSTHPFAATAANWLFLLGTSLVVTWSIRDQLTRCRTCLRRFGMEVYLWGAGRTFLEITGAELVCDQGHGTLHVPEMQSGNVDSERWAYMDDSWRILGPRPPEE